MTELRIKTESLPERCEICHQTDCFDADRNFCSRCDAAGEILRVPADNSLTPTTSRSLENRLRLARRFPRLITTIWFAIAGVIPIIFAIAFFYLIIKVDVLREDEYWIYGVLLPILVATICGFCFGSTILDSSRTR